MRVYPAIDLKEGNVVRLLQGRADQKTVYNEDPGVPARQFREAGADWIHVVDLDGAFSGKQGNVAAVERVLEEGLHVQLGGGIRNWEAMDFWFSKGVSRLVVGTAATQKGFMQRAVERYGAEKLAVGIDAMDGKVAVKGWVEVTELGALDFARQMEAAGVQTAIYTDIGRDGMLAGPNFEAQEEFLQSSSLRLIASGGVADVSDLDRFQEMSLSYSQLDGVITGKALYDGRIDLGLWLKNNSPS